MEEQLELWADEWTQETIDPTPDKTTSREWIAVRDGCVSGGSLIDSCDIIRASQGTGQLEVVEKKLSCGCVLIRESTF